MGWEIDRLWGELKRQLRWLAALNNDVSEHTKEIADIKKALLSERAKRGWATRRTKALQRDLGQLLTRVEQLEKSRSQDEAEARTILDEVEAHVDRLH